MEDRMRKRSLKVRRELLGTSMLFTSISLVMLAYTILDLRMGISLRLTEMIPRDVGVLSDTVFVVAVPVVLAVLILQSFVFYRILKRLVESKRDESRAAAPFDRTAVGNRMPVNVEFLDPEERGMMVTLQ